MELLRHICLWVLSKTDAASVALVAGLSLFFILQASDWARVSTPARHYFSTYITMMDQHQNSVQCTVSGVNELSICVQVSSIDLCSLVDIVLLAVTLPSTN